MNLSHTKTRVAVVTGASAGLGRSIAKSLATEGFKIGLIARNPEALAAAKQECIRAGSEAICCIVDVSDADAVEAAAQKIENVLGPIDVWINNAMVSVISPVHEMEPADYKRVTDVLYLGFVHGTLSALRRMRVRNSGMIIQIGSALAYRSIPLQSAYCACKHAINGFTDSLRCELLHERSNVKLTAVHMPAMNTTQFGWVKNRMKNMTQPVPPIYEPGLCARVVVEAARSAHPRREYWVGAPTVGAILGQKFVPGLLDRYLGRTGYDSQQLKGQPQSTEQTNNLYHFVSGAHGAEGRFSERSMNRSAAIEFSLHKRSIIAGLTLFLGGGLLVWRAVRK